MRIAEFLVGSIDESGYIRLELEEIVDDLAFTQNLFVNEDELMDVLKIVQDLIHLELEHLIFKNV